MDGLKVGESPPVVYLTEISFYCQTLREVEEAPEYLSGNEMFLYFTAKPLLVD